jgi:ribosome biogenesis protein Nip4
LKPGDRIFAENIIDRGWYLRKVGGKNGFGKG